ncbi:hypothetical protein LCGC14_0851780 [marine sediment metagenome]|uniref:Uncharacterized protein n=1 Tax=marine sediment metagenome TaxID=412755 RepID=A0A0F9RUJ9_9ZZZZ
MLRRQLIWRMGKVIVSKYKIKEIQAMLKILPLDVSVCLEDLGEIYSQDDETTNTKTSYQL